jgi:hypothetical protein
MKNAFLAAVFLLLSLCGMAMGQTATGTGFVISTDGYIATNYHVVSGGQVINIRSHKGEIFPASVVLTDRSNDLAVLRIEPRKLPTLRISPSDFVRKGEAVITIGFPNVGLQGFDPKVTEGIVSSLAGIKGEPNSFQISVPLQPGNSGGPLLDATGSVIGIVTSKLNAEAMLKSSGTLPEAVNYAVKSNYLWELIRTEPNIRASIGNTSPASDKRSRLGFAEIVERAEKSIVLVIVFATEQTGTAKSNRNNQLPPNPRSEHRGREWCPDIDNFCDSRGFRADKSDAGKGKRDWCPEKNNFCD